MLNWISLAMALKSIYWWTWNWIFFSVICGLELELRKLLGLEFSQIFLSVNSSIIPNTRKSIAIPNKSDESEKNFKWFNKSSSQQRNLFSLKSTSNSSLLELPWFLLLSFDSWFFVQLSTRREKHDKDQQEYWFYFLLFSVENDFIIKVVKFMRNGIWICINNCWMECWINPDGRAFEMGWKAIMELCGKPVETPWNHACSCILHLSLETSIFLITKYCININYRVVSNKSHF